jgi:hypothetical protein
VLLKLARGTSKPTDDQRELAKSVSAAYGQAAFGLTGPNTKNKVTGRKVWTVIAAIAGQK